ncbi:hypothetical protein D9M71_438790 [compost metagenome]
MGQVQRIDGADDSTADARVGEQQLEAGLHRVDTRGQADMPAGQGLFHQDGLAVFGSVVQHRAFCLLVEVVGDHGAVALLQRLQAAGDSLAGQAETEDLALLLELGQGLVHLLLFEDCQVVAVGMHQHQFDAVGFQAAQAALHRAAGVGGAEIEVRLAVVEFFANLADDHPFVTLAAQQRAQALFAAAIGRRGVDQVDAHITREFEQHARFVIIGDLETVRVFHPLIAAEFYRAQAQGRHQQAGAAQGPMQVVQSGLAHGSSCSQAGTPIGGFGSAGNALAGPG